MLISAFFFRRKMNSKLLLLSKDSSTVIFVSFTAFIRRATGNGNEADDIGKRETFILTD
jgi:hypothetical protein